MQFARHIRRRSRMIDKNRTLGHAAEGTPVADRHGAQVIVIADAGEHEVSSLGCLFRRRSGLAAVFLGPLLGLGGGAVVHRDLMSAFGLEIPGHRIPHDPQSDPCNALRHDLFS